MKGSHTLIPQELETIIRGRDGAVDPTLDPTLVVTRFYIFAVCINLGDRGEAVTQGLEELTTASARYFYHTLHHVTVADPNSTVLEVIRGLYHKVFPTGIDFTGLPSRHMFVVVEALIRRAWGRHHIWRDVDRPCNHEYTPFARDFAELAQVEYQPERRAPGWILAFALDTLSQDPLPTASTVVDCLKIIAIDLGCNVSDAVASDERYICSVLLASAS